MKAVWCFLIIPLLFALSSGLCPGRRLRLGDRCLELYPVWASWSTAETLCSRSNSHLISIHSNKDLESLQTIVTKLAVPVWIGGYLIPQADLWFWSDDSDINYDIWTNRTSDEACLGMTKEDGVKSAPCGELRFYICYKKMSQDSFSSDEQAVVSSGLSPGISLFALMWDKTEVVADEILRSSSFLLQLKSGSVTQSCYDLFIQQEALYMGLVSRTLEALAFPTREAIPGVRSLLLDANQFYRTKYSKQDLGAAPLWLQFALQSFHSVVADDPVYLLVALSARSALNSFALQSVPLPGSMSSPESKSLYQKWREESERDVAFTDRVSKVIEYHQREMDVFKSIDVFRLHMMNQKSLHKHVECDL